MALRWVLLILLLLIVLLCRIRVGVRAELGEEAVLFLRVGLLRFRLLPAKAKKPKRPKKEKKADKPRREKKSRRGKRPFPRPTLSDIREAVQTLAPPLGRALRRLLRGIRIAPMDLSASLAGAEDPAGAAALYGRLNGALWALPPLPKGREIRLSVDYGAMETKIRGTAAVSVRIGTVLAAAWTVAVPAARYLIRYLRRKRKQPPAPAGARASSGKDGS